MSAPKLCKDCRHAGIGIFGKIDTLTRCRHPSFGINLLTGAADEGFCDIERSNVLGNCKAAGLLWERRE